MNIVVAALQLFYAFSAKTVKITIAPTIANKFIVMQSKIFK